MEEKCLRVKVTDIMRLMRFHAQVMVLFKINFRQKGILHAKANDFQVLNRFSC